MRASWCVAGAVMGGWASAGSAQVAYMMRSDDTVAAWRAGTQRAESFGRVPTSTHTGGFEIGADGRVWAVDWGMILQEWDRTRSAWVVRYDLRQANGSQMSGFMKDLAWDPVGGRLLVLLVGRFPEFRSPDSTWILAIDPTNGHLSLVGRAPDLDPYTRDYPMGLAVDSTGTVWVLTSSDRELFRLTPSAEGFSAQRVVQFPTSAGFTEALAVDWRRGDQMYVGGTNGMWQVGPGWTLGQQVTRSAVVDAAMSPCEADVDTDGFVDMFDYATFVGRFEAGEPRADLTGDGVVDLQDYARMVEAFERGC